MVERKIINNHPRFKYAQMPFKKPYWAPKEIELLENDDFYMRSIQNTSAGLEIRHLLLASRSIKAIQSKKWRLRSGYSRAKKY